jgi:hypothetical protein
VANKAGRRRFGNVRKLPSGRFQIRYPGPDGRMRTGGDTYETKTLADRALVIIEGQMVRGEWVDPERGKVLLRDYADRWITQRPNLRSRTVELYGRCWRTTSCRSWAGWLSASCPRRWCGSGGRRC